MSIIVNKFNELIDSHENTYYGYRVDLAEITEVCNNATPSIQLKLSVDSSKYLAETIVRNLCKRAPQYSYPLYGLRAINSIISKDVSINDTEIQQVMLLHFTKMMTDVHTLSWMFRKLGAMTCEIRVDENVELWLKVANETVTNKRVRNLIDQVITDSFGEHLADKVSETENCEVNVSFISSEEHLIRGFSGFSTIYINRNHFDKKLTKSTETDLILLDVATVTIHELAHVRVRQVFDDLNMSSPAALMTGNDIDDPEFGRIVERKLFGCPVDWLLSYAEGNVPTSYINEFMKFIRGERDLPNVPTEAVLFPRNFAMTFYAGGGCDVSGGFSQ